MGYEEKVNILFSGHCGCSPFETASWYRTNIVWNLKGAWPFNLDSTISYAEKAKLSADSYSGRHNGFAVVASLP